MSEFEQYRFEGQEFHAEHQQVVEMQQEAVGVESGVVDVSVLTFQEQEALHAVREALGNLY